MDFHELSRLNEAVSKKLRAYLQDPFLCRLYSDIRTAGPIKAISMDITHACNIRCRGCYFFEEKMDKNKMPEDEAEFDAFIDREKARGTNFITVIGGEPSLVLDRLKKLHDNFSVAAVTNGVQKIPYEGFENMSIGVSIWGDHETDKKLRGGGKIDIFSKALRNFRDDPRVQWYYTTTPGHVNEIERVVEQCIANGNYVVFTFYGDISQARGDLDHRLGYSPVVREINRMIKRYPDRILITSYMCDVIVSGQLYDEKWGYDVCSSVTFDHEMNRNRVKNGKPYNKHFRAYNPDLKSTRRCCVGNDRDCSTCFDVWAHFSWIMMNLRRHLGSKKEFSNWLTTVYLFYVINRIMDLKNSVELLPEIHRCSSHSYEPDKDASTTKFRKLEA